MIWAFFGILHSFFRAAFAETNRVFRVDGTRLNFWHAAFGMLFMAPFLPFIEWDMPVSLYVAALIVGLVLTAGSLMQLILTSQKEGRVSSMNVPLEAMVAFVIWFFLMPEMMSNYVSDAQGTTMTGLGYVVATVGLMRIRQNDMGWKGFSKIVPGAVALGLSGVLIKMVAPSEMLPHAAFTFVFVSYAIMTLLMGFVLLIRKEATRELLETNLLQAGVLAGVFSASSFVCLIFSLAYASNPAYPVVLVMLVPVWLFLYHKIRKEEDNASPQAAMAIVLGVALLVGANL